LLRGVHSNSGHFYKGGDQGKAQVCFVGKRKDQEGKREREAERETGPKFCGKVRKRSRVWQPYGGNGGIKWLEVTSPEKKCYLNLQTKSGRGEAYFVKQTNTQRPAFHGGVDKK